jgi:predicted RND superfamily exporter protein
MALTLAILTAIAFIGCLRISTDPSNERLFLRHSDAYRTLQRFKTIFGSDETILVALHDPAQPLLRPDGIAAIRALTRALANLPHVTSVVSLTTVRDLSNLRITPFGIAAPPLVEGNRLSETQIASIRANDLVMGTLLSTDLHTAGLLVTPSIAGLAPEAQKSWIAAMRALGHHHAMPGRNLYMAGTLLERHDVETYLRRDQRLTLPLVFVILLLVTLGLYRSFRLALVPLVCMSLALCWTMGMVGFSGLPLNLITSLLPPIITVVSISAAIHLLNRFLDVRTTGRPAAEAVQQAIQHVGAACLLAALTTMMGFFSLLVSPSQPCRNLQALPVSASAWLF